MNVTCQNLDEWIYDFVEGELTEETRVSVHVHIAGCLNCSLSIESYRYTVRLSRALPRSGPLPGPVADRLAALLKQHLAGEARG